MVTAEHPYNPSVHMRIFANRIDADKCAAVFVSMIRRSLLDRANIDDDFWPQATPDNWRNLQTQMEDSGEVWVDSTEMPLE